MLEVIINRYKVNCTNTKFEFTLNITPIKKPNGNVCPKKCVTLSRLSCLITDKENFKIKIDLFKQTLPHEQCN